MSTFQRKAARSAQDVRQLKLPVGFGFGVDPSLIPGQLANARSNIPTPATFNGGQRFQGGGRVRPREDDGYAASSQNQPKRAKTMEELRAMAREGGSATNGSTQTAPIVPSIRTNPGLSAMTSMGISTNRVPLNGGIVAPRRNSQVDIPEGAYKVKRDLNASHVSNTVSVMEGYFGLVMRPLDKTNRNYTPFGGYSIVEVGVTGSQMMTGEEWPLVDRFVKVSVTYTTTPMSKTYGNGRNAKEFDLSKQEVLWVQYKTPYLDAHAVANIMIDCDESGLTDLALMEAEKILGVIGIGDTSSNAPVHWKKALLEHIRKRNPGRDPRSRTRYFDLEKYEEVAKIMRDPRVLHTLTPSTVDVIYHLYRESVAPWMLYNREMFSWIPGVKLPKEIMSFDNMAKWYRDTQGRNISVNELDEVRFFVEEFAPFCKENGHTCLPQPVVERLAVRYLSRSNRQMQTTKHGETSDPNVSEVALVDKMRKESHRYIVKTPSNNLPASERGDAMEVARRHFSSTNLDDHPSEGWKGCWWFNVKDYQSAHGCANTLKRFSMMGDMDEGPASMDEETYLSVLDEVLKRKIPNYTEMSVDQLAAVKSLRTKRVVNITGSGGCGKTSICIAAVRVIYEIVWSASGKKSPTSQVMVVAATGAAAENTRKACGMGETIDMILTRYSCVYEKEDLYPRTAGILKNHMMSLGLDTRGLDSIISEAKKMKRTASRSLGDHVCKEEDLVATENAFKAELALVECLVVDEASRCPEKKLNALFKILPNLKQVVFVNDNEQTGPCGKGHVTSDLKKWLFGGFVTIPNLPPSTAYHSLSTVHRYNTEGHATIHTACKSILSRSTRFGFGVDDKMTMPFTVRLSTDVISDVDKAYDFMSDIHGHKVHALAHSNKTVDMINEIIYRTQYYKLYQMDPLDLDQSTTTTHMYSNVGGPRNGNNNNRRTLNLRKLAISVGIKYMFTENYYGFDADAGRFKPEHHPDGTTDTTPANGSSTNRNRSSSNNNNRRGEPSVQEHMLNYDEMLKMQNPVAPDIYGSYSVYNGDRWVIGSIFICDKNRNEKKRVKHCTRDELYKYPIKVYNWDHTKWVFLRDVGFDRIVLGYASTIDKFQGKEEEVILGVMEPGGVGHNFKLNHLTTMTSRGKDKTLLITERSQKRVDNSQVALHRLMSKEELFGLDDPEEEQEVLGYMASLLESTNIGDVILSHPRVMRNGGLHALLNC